MCCAVASEQEWTPLENSKQGDVNDAMNRALSALAIAKGIHFELVKLLDVQKKNSRYWPEESTYDGMTDAEFKTKSGEIINCNLDKKDDAFPFLLNCGEDDYTIIVKYGSS